MIDPWGNPYEIQEYETTEARIVSMGPDMKPNTGDDLSQYVFKVH